MSSCKFKRHARFNILNEPFGNKTPRFLKRRRKILTEMARKELEKLAKAKASQEPTSTITTSEPEVAA